MNSAWIWSIIIGALASFLIAYLFYRLQKVQKYPSRLSYCILTRSKILQQVNSSFPEFSLKYKGYSIAKDMYYIEVLLFNTRTSDVSAPKSASPVSFLLPEGSKWIDVQIKKGSPQINSSIQVSTEDKSCADLFFDLLRNKEYILIEGMIESSDDLVDFGDCDLKIKHRVPNLDSFDFVSIDSWSYYRSLRKETRSDIIRLIPFLGLASSMVLFPDKFDFFARPAFSLVLILLLLMLLLNVPILISNFSKLKKYSVVRSILEAKNS